MRKIAFLSGTALRSAAAVSVMLVAAQPALAQDAQDEEEAEQTVTEAAQSADPAEAVGEGDAIVVTGSRIRSSTPFNSPDPITVIDPALAQASGQFNTAEMIQSSTIAAGSAQITSAISSAFVTNGGPGAETISLRGLGAERTLVLLNGRRAGPAGTRGAVSAFDLNVLPQSIVQSVEILKTGASSIYGSDAVAGVVNLITKKNTRGFEISGFTSVPEQGGGEQYRLSGTWGTTFAQDRGHVLFAVDYNKRQALQRKDRDYLGCPEEYIFRRDGSRADMVDPRTGQYRCNDTLWGHVWIYDYNFAQFGRWQADYGDNLGAYIPRENPANAATYADPDGFGPFGFPTNFRQVGYNSASTAVDNAYHPFYGNESLIPETERLTAYFDAAYKLTDGLEVGAEVLYNKRITKSTSYRQFWTTQYTEEFFPGFGDPYTTGWSGPYFLSPTTITDHFDQSQRVEYARGLLWADGKIGSSWNFNAYYQFSSSIGRYTSDIIYDDSVDSQAGRTGSCVGTTTRIRGVPCIDINWTTPAFLRGDFTPEERAFLFGEDTGRTVYTQHAAELSASGKLFELPYGTLQIAGGIAYRRDEINDTPGPVTMAKNPSYNPALSPGQTGYQPEFVSNSWGLTSGGITAGYVETKEAFGEAEIPLLKDIPFIQSLTLSGSGRVTNVKAVRASDGVTFDDNNNWTYSVGVNWQLTDWLRFRGRYGTSFRAPALFEQFLANQTSFLQQRSVDPCIGYGLANAQQNDRVKANCAAAGVPGNHAGGGASATVVQGGGLGVLEPETSTAKSISAVLTPKFGFLPNTRISVAVDYFDIEIKGEIATLSAANIVGGCYNSDFFPNDPLCSLFNRIPTGSAGSNNIDRVTATFININSQRNRGIDVTASINQDLGSLGNISLLAQMTWQIEDEVALFDNTATDSTGEAGEPRWVGDFNIVYAPSDRVSIFYGLDVIGATSDEGDYRSVTANIAPGTLCRPSTIYGEFCVDVKAEARFYHNLSATLKLDGFDLTFGVSNLMDTKPPRVTIGGTNSLNGGTISTVGNSVFSSQYDYIGRRFFISTKANF